MKTYEMTIRVDIDPGYHPDQLMNDLVDQWQALPIIEGITWDNVDWKEVSYEV